MGLPERMLKVQYRMHPSIREFPSTMFYERKLVEDQDNLPNAEHRSQNTEVPIPFRWGARWLQFLLFS